VRCPECQIAVAGGTTCPACHQPVPERETFGGQGAYYLRVLLGVSAVVVALFFTLSILGWGWGRTVYRFTVSQWRWLYLALIALPIGIGIYNWVEMHNDEITVTDEYIERRSRWGVQRLAWRDVKGFHSHSIVPRRSWLWRTFAVKRWLSREYLMWHLPWQSYELVGPPDAKGGDLVILLEPGTIDEFPWLLSLINERIGEPEEG